MRHFAYPVDQNLESMRTCICIGASSIICMLQLSVGSRWREMTVGFVFEKRVGEGVDLNEWKYTARDSNEMTDWTGMWTGYDPDTPYAVLV